MSDDWLPEPSEASAPFFAGAKESRLRLQCCNDCGRWTFPVRARCQSCGGTEIGWRDASGNATLYSFGLLHRVYHPRHEGRLPIVLAQVDLEEGVRLPTNVVGVEPAEVKIGMALRVGFETLPDGTVIPVFELA